MGRAAGSAGRGQRVEGLDPRRVLVFRRRCGHRGDLRLGWAWTPLLGAPCSPAVRGCGEPSGMLPERGRGPGGTTGPRIRSSCQSLERTERQRVCEGRRRGSAGRHRPDNSGDGGGSWKSETGDFERVAFRVRGHPGEASQSDSGCEATSPNRQDRDRAVGVGAQR